MNEWSCASLWDQITNFGSFCEEIQEVAKNGIQAKVGNGAQSRFWDDFWTGEENLKTLFPRLFKLSMQKNDLIERMGVWENGVWEWKLLWRRKLFAREEESVNELLVAVNRVPLSENTSDERLWAFDKTNSFSVSNFVLQVSRIMAKEDPSLQHSSMAWRNLAPPRAQLQLWFILQGRLNTKERLFKLGFPGIEDNRCTLCK